jgi:25S rRNA (adenine2142-N1)-methyltransferase
LTAADAIAQAIEGDGGLEKYQKASQTGQMNERGGDTSKVLVEWLHASGITRNQSKLRVLEVGCLSPDNFISKVKGVEMVRIDLRSTHPQILEQNFMERPLPSRQEEYFDIVSLSLVLNYLPDIQERGDMLFRTTRFVTHPATMGDLSRSTSLPLLFLTLPLPCVSNSRYLTTTHLERIMSGLGYKLLNSKESTKIYYSLWKLSTRLSKPKTCSKLEVNPGNGRNNFSVVVK